ncbi:hypothetical protein F5Y17DRAFT_306129 [Xylariaceae sp. FL0594]|nr:hypothetical protein F5Y17DRAFT_306129 [Xylariaceae sp. FL0594]
MNSSGLRELCTVSSSTAMPRVSNQFNPPGEWQASSLGPSLPGRTSSLPAFMNSFTEQYANISQSKTSDPECNSVLLNDQLTYAPAINYFVDHDIAWGYLLESYFFHHRLPQAIYSHRVLTQGIREVYALCRANTYYRCHKHLAADHDMTSHSNDSPLPIHFGLLIGARSPGLLQLDEAERAAAIRHPFFEESDTGPRAIWEWVYRDTGPSFSMYHPNHQCYRDWAYPFWDLAWLSPALIGNESIPSDDDWENFDWEELRRYRSELRNTALVKSQLVRKELFKQGKRGYFNPNDYPEVSALYREAREAEEAEELGGAEEAHEV